MRTLGQHSYRILGDHEGNAPIVLVFDGKTGEGGTIPETRIGGFSGSQVDVQQDSFAGAEWHSFYLSVKAVHIGQGWVSAPRYAEGL